MEDFTSRLVSLVSYEEIYLTKLQPKLQAIDIMLKSNTTAYSVTEVSDLLGVKRSQLEDAMAHLDINEINKLNFFELVFHFSTPICHLIKKGWCYNHSALYTPEMIADIYNLDLGKVIHAFEDLDLDFVTDENLHDVFKRIHTTLFHHGCC